MNKNKNKNKNKNIYFQVNQYITITSSIGILSVWLFLAGRGASIAVFSPRPQWRVFRWYRISRFFAIDRVGFTMQSDLVGLHACCGVFRAEFCQHIFCLVRPLLLLTQAVSANKKGIKSKPRPTCLRSRYRYTEQTLL